MRNEQKAALTNPVDISSVEVKGDYGQVIVTRMELLFQYAFPIPSRALVSMMELSIGSLLITTVVPLLRDHPVVHTKVVFEEGWSFIRGRKQCKPKHVSSGILVLNVRWGGGGGGRLSRGGPLYY